jgi:hypothetical protein
MFLHATLIVTNTFSSTFKKKSFIYFVHFMSYCLNEFDRALKETLIRYSEVNITCLINYNTDV